MGQYRALGDLFDEINNLWAGSGSGTFDAGASDPLIIQPPTLPPDISTLPGNTIDLATLKSILKLPVSGVVYSGPKQVTQGGQTYDVVQNLSTGLLSFKPSTNIFGSLGTALKGTAFAIGGTPIPLWAVLGVGGMTLFLASRNKGMSKGRR